MEGGVTSSASSGAEKKEEEAPRFHASRTWGLGEGPCLVSTPSERHKAYSVTLPRSDVSWIEEESKNQARVRTLIESRAYQVWICWVVVAGWALCCIEVDVRSAQRTAYWDEHESIDGFRYKPDWRLEVLNYIAVGTFAIDCIARLYTSNLRSYCCQLLNVFDLLCVLSDVSLLCLSHIGDKPVLAFMRIFRALKLIRAIRTSSIFRDLYLMLDGLRAAIRPISFAVIMLMAFLSICAVVAVEFVHVDNMAFQRAGIYGDCPDYVCKDAFGSVWHAMMTFFKTIIAGDSWGQMNYPLVTERPQHAWILLGSILMIQVGLLNLIVAVMVDRTHEARQRDDEFMLAEKRDAYEFTRDKLRSLYATIDADHSGAVSVEEMRNAYQTLPEFRFILDSLDVREWEMDMVFEICDYNKDDEINFDEFVEAMYNLKSRNPVTLLMYIRQHTAKLVGLMELANRRMDRQESALCKVGNAVLERNARSATPSESTRAMRLTESLRIAADAPGACAISNRGDVSPLRGLQEDESQSDAQSAVTCRSLAELSCAADAAFELTAELNRQLDEALSLSHGSESPTSSPCRGGAGGEACRPLIPPVYAHLPAPMSTVASAYDSPVHASHRPTRAPGNGPNTAQAAGDTAPVHRTPGRKCTHPQAIVPPSSKSLGADILARPTAQEEPRKDSRPGTRDAHGQAALLAYSGATDPAFTCDESSAGPSSWRGRMPGA